MINFEEELNRFRPAPVLDDAEKVIRENVVADLKDIIMEVQTGKAENEAKTDVKQEQ
jgi:hypothetical protein